MITGEVAQIMIVRTALVCVYMRSVRISCFVWGLVEVV